MGSELLEYFKGDELAAGVWQGKYAQEGEVTPDDMHKRMAKEFARIEKMYQEDKKTHRSAISHSVWNSLSYYGRHREELQEEDIYGLFKDFKYIIPQGSIMSQLGSKSIGSLSNCFVVGQPQDSYGGIFLKDEEMAQLMKRRGGVGIDVSTLRPEGTKTTNAAKSSTGMVSFMHRYSNTTREVAQNGRRGALMISTDINHPDVLKFVQIKRDLSQVTGANISIKLNDEFMEAVRNDEDYILRFPCDQSFEQIVNQDSLKYDELVDISFDTDAGSIIGYVKKIKAKELWDEIIESAHGVAEPGLMFWGAMVNYSPDGVYPQFKQVTTNPCSEIGMQPYDACRLIAVNLFSFVKNPYTSEAYFDYEEFYKINYEAMRLSDDLIDLEIEHINRILDKIENDPESVDVKMVEYNLWAKVKETAQASRRTGLGFTAMGDALAALGFKYDSDAALQEIELIMHKKMESELDCTIDLAILRGTFEGWDKTKEFEYVDTEEPGVQQLRGKNDFYDFIAQNYRQAKRMYHYGRRNVSWSTVAPTGTVSLLTQTTSGVEPLFMPFYMRRKKVNPNDVGARVDFTDLNGDTWQEFPVLHPKFKDWINYTYGAEIITAEGGMGKEELQEWFEKSPFYGSNASDINWVRRVEIQGIIQKYITHSISSTINLPSDVKKEEVSEIYLESWKKGLKGITVYRDGSRSGVLVSGTSTKENKFEYHDAIQRPKEVDAEMHVVNAKSSKFTVLVGLIEGKPYEVFGYDYAPEDGKSRKGKLTKKKKSEYVFVDEDGPHTVSGEMSDEQAAITRLVSTSLRHGADIKFIVEQLNKCDGDLFSFTKALARVLKKYIPDGVKSTVKCNDCGSDNVIFQEGCMSCQDCGSSKCG